MDCPTLTAKTETLQQENNKLLADKRDLLADRKRDKEEVERFTQQIAKLRFVKGSEKSKKRNK